jgi:hypothetical protein
LKRAGRAYPVGSVTHVVMTPPRTIACTACGETKGLQATSPSLAGQTTFNQRVYDWVEAHRGCAKQEVRCES